MLESLNERALSWAECTVTTNVVGGATIENVDIKSIDHETSVEVGEQRGRGGGRVKKRTTGQGKSTASATFYREGLRQLKRALMEHAPRDAQGALQLSLVTFDIVVQHSFSGDDPDIHTTKLLGCRLLKDAGKHAEGTDAETVDVDLSPLSIVEVIDGEDTVLL